jgi:hypothetical protein
MVLLLPKSSTLTAYVPGDRFFAPASPAGVMAEHAPGPSSSSLAICTPFGLKRKISVSAPDGQPPRPLDVEIVTVEPGTVTSKLNQSLSPTGLIDPTAPS